MSTEDNLNMRPRKEMTGNVKYLNIAVLSILLGVSAYIIIRVVNDKGVVLFTYHPTFIILGYLILMSNAILIMSDNHFLTKHLSYHQRITAHWIVQASALTLILIAQACIFTNKINFNKPHLQTTHSLFGICTVSLTILSAMDGISAKYSYHLRNFIKPALSKLMHILLGVSSYTLAIITIILGFNQLWNSEGDVIIKSIIIILLVFSGFYVLIKTLLLLPSRIKNVLSN
ncbi:hypothetical protein PVAND_001889 [Polypedilum vanderplanki]|uniref:ascorbate ferrireductase (transmembrane) n=1 Tax=Polypedilum vanderplanki TaxID=319348 RepID=A0A9J6BPT5_POLVA|nr:hypothetical protein PVAND_001889 [Polypedilum vanderplanki]